MDALIRLAVSSESRKDDVLGSGVLTIAFIENLHYVESRVLILSHSCPYFF